MRIALLFHPELHIGGVETHLLSLLRCSPPIYDWVVIAPTSTHFKVQVEALGGRVVDWDLRNPIFDVNNFRCLANILRNEKVDILHIHSPRATFIGRVVAFLTHIPVVITLHLDLADLHYVGDTWRARGRRWLALCLDYLLNYTMTSYTIFVSSLSYQDALLRHRVLKSRAVVIPNGIDLTVFKIGNPSMNLRRQQKIIEDSTLLCYIGRLHKKKGVDILLQAVSLLKSRENWNLWIVGDGDIRVELELLMHRLALDERICFWGFREDVGVFLQAADVFVFPSHYEGFGIAVLEAMAFGLPCVSTPVGEIPALIEDGVNGRLVAVGDVNGLADALAQLIEDVGLRQKMGQAARQVAVKYDQKTMTEQVLQVYQDVRPTTN